MCDLRSFSGFYAYGCNVSTSLLSLSAAELDQREFKVAHSFLYWTKHEFTVGGFKPVFMPMAFCGHEYCLAFAGTMNVYLHLG